MVFLEGFLDVGEFGAARPAPSGPEIDEDDFAFMEGDGDGLAGEVGFLEIGEGSAGDEGGLDFLGGFAVLEAGDDLVGLEADFGFGVFLFELLNDGDGFVGVAVVRHDLGIKGGFKVENVGDLVGFLVFVLGEQVVGGLEQGGVVLFVVFFFLEERFDFGDEVLGVGGEGGIVLGQGGLVAEEQENTE